MAEPATVTAIPTPFTEIGVSGSEQVATHIYEDFLPQLRGRQALATYREMSDNDATIGSILYAIEMQMRGVTWRVQSATEDPVDLAAAQFLEENLTGLSAPFTDTVGQMTTAIPYGFSFHETVYRRGVDGKIRWDRFAPRPQDSLVRWLLADDNTAQGFVQSVQGRPPVTIPLVKGIHFRVDTTSPSGKSLIRRAYRSWFFKKRAEEKLQIALDRNLNGIPIAYVPSEILAAGAGDERYDMIRKIVTRTRRDEQAGLMFPSDRASNGERLYEFSLLSPDGNPGFDQTVNVIRMYAGDIAGVVLAQFINLGRDTVGSRALAEPQQELFQSSLEAVLDAMQAALNRQAVAPLFELNPGMIPEGRPLPVLEHGPVRDVDLLGTADFVLKTAQGGAIWPFEDEQFMSRLMQLAGFDPSSDSVSNRER